MPNGKDKATKVPTTWEEYLKQPEWWPTAEEWSPPAPEPVTPTPPTVAPTVPSFPWWKRVITSPQEQPPEVPYELEAWREAWRKTIAEEAKIPYRWGEVTPYMYGTWPESWFPGQISPYTYGTYPESWPMEYSPVLKAEEEFGQRYASEPFRNLPKEWELYPAEDKINWLSYSSYGTMLLDQFGKQLSRADLRNLARTDPDADVYIVYSRGGGNVAEMVIPASDALRVEVPTDLLETHPELFTPAGQKPWAKEDTFEAVKAGVLKRSDWTYEQKLSELYDTAAKLGMGVTPQLVSQIKHEVYESLTPEEQRQREIEGMKGEGEAESKRMWQEWMRRYGQKIDYETWLKADLGKGLVAEPKAEVVDTAKLQESLKPYGANILENYPYISLMPEQTLMGLPPETLDLMAQYLGEKGMSWREYLSITSSFYGGRGGGRGRYSIPAQWS